MTAVERSRVAGRAARWGGILGLTLVISVGISAPVTGAESDVCSADVLTIRNADSTALKACSDLSGRKVSYGPTSTDVLEVPAKGHGWTLTVQSDDPSVPSEVSVDHNLDNSLSISYVQRGIRVSAGPLSLSAQHSELVAPSAAAAAAGECTSTRYKKDGFKQVGTYKFYVRTSNASYPTGGASRIQDAAATIIGENNACSIAGDTGITYSYGGTTTNDAYVPNDANDACAPADGDSKNVFTFGTLTNAVAATCTYRAFGNVLSADTTFSNSYTWWTSTATTGCSGKRDVMATATHEIGHAFGLGDLTGTTNDYTTQTMYGKSGACAFARRSLGSGDVAGLESIY